MASTAALFLEFLRLWFTEFLRLMSFCRIFFGYRDEGPPPPTSEHAPSFTKLLGDPFAPGSPRFEPGTTSSFAFALLLGADHGLCQHTYRPVDQHHLTHLIERRQHMHVTAGGGGWRCMSRMAAFFISAATCTRNLVPLKN